MKKEDYLIAQELKGKLLNVVPLLDFKLYGSRARGFYSEDSDMDVFIEVESINKILKEKIHDIAWEVGFEHSIVISVLIFTKNEIENSPLRISPIVKNIMEEGIVI